MTERSGLTQRTFARRFQAATGRRPIDYVHALRIEGARDRLESGDDPVDDIGFAVGYADPTFFRRLFKRSPASRRRPTGGSTRRSCGPDRARDRSGSSVMLPTSGGGRSGQCPTPSVGGGENVTIRDELDAINAGFGEAFATQDVERLAAFYADDARLLFHGQPVIRGRAEVDATLREMVADGPASLRFVTDEVIADGSLVVDIGRIISPTGRASTWWSTSARRTEA